MSLIDHMPPWIREYSRSIMVLTISVTIGLIGLLALTQISMIEQAHSKSASSYSLVHDITALRTQWSRTQVLELNQKAQNAELMLLRDFDHLAVWLKQVETQASLMGLRSKYRVRSARTRVVDLNDVEMISVDLEILPEHLSVLTGVYEQYIHFLRFLTEDQIRVDVQEVDVRGGAGAAHMNVLIHVWVKVTA